MRFGWLNPFHLIRKGTKELTQNITGERQARISYEQAGDRLRASVNQLNALGIKGKDAESHLKNLLAQSKHEYDRGKQNLQSLSKSTRQEIGKLNKTISEKEKFFESSAATQTEKLKALGDLPKPEAYQQKFSEYSEKKSQLDQMLLDFTSHMNRLQGRENQSEALLKAFRGAQSNVQDSRNRLLGLNEESDPMGFKTHKEGYDNLKRLHQETTKTLKNLQGQSSEEMPVIQEKHQRLSEALSGLSPLYASLKQEDDKLTAAAKIQKDIDEIQKGQADFQEKELPLLQGKANEKKQALASAVKQLSGVMNQRQSEIQGKTDELKNYQAQAKNFESLIAQQQRELESAADKYKSRAQIGSLISAAVMALATHGAGSAIGAGAGLIGGVGGQALTSGISTATNYASVLAGLNEFQRSMQGKAEDMQNKIGSMDNPDLSFLSHSRDDYKINDLKNVDYVKGLPDIRHLKDVFANKQPVPELGGIRQSMAHFGLPTLPELKDLPDINASLGRIPASVEFLGVPKAEGLLKKKFGNLAYLNPDFLKLAKKTLGGRHAKQH